MSSQQSTGYAVPALSSVESGVDILTIPPGTNILLTGPGRLVSNLATRLTLEGRGDTHDGAGSDDDGSIIVSTNQTVENFLRESRGTYPDLDERRTGYVDATGRGTVDVDTEMPVRSVSSTGDLTGISIGVSVLYSALTKRGIGRLRYCYNSLSYLLLYTNPKTIVRFVHTVSGRISATNGIGFFTLDPSMHDERIRQMLGHTVDAAASVEMRDGVPSVRIEGLPTVSDEWRPIEQ
jgi:hypothetical protein